MTRDVLAFVGVVAVIVLVPGPDMALVLRNGLVGGRRAALETALGIVTGLLGWAAAAALGIAALLHASATAFSVMKLAGAAYLVWLGLRTLRRAWRRAPADAAAQSASAHSAFRQGVLSNLLNPKIALAFTTLIPQFVEPGDPVLTRTTLLAAIFIAIGLLWLTTYALLVGQLAKLLRTETVRRTIDTLAGTVLVALGVRLAFERR